MILLLIWIGLFFFSLFFVVSYNQWDFSLAYELKYASLNIEYFYNFVMGLGNVSGMDIRFYQYLGVALTGAALAACGAVFQGAFKNVLAGPSTMGVMAGGTLGCTVYLLLFCESETISYVTQADMESYYAMSIWGRYQQQFCVLIGCFAGVILVMTLSRIAGKGQMSSKAMLLCGMVFSSVVSNLNMLVQYYMLAQNPDDTRIEAIRDMMLGNFNNITNGTVLALLGIPILLCLIVLLLISGKLNILSFGMEEAQTMGMSVSLYQNIVIVVGTVLTAVVVAFCGRIGFVGFMVPMITRRVAGPDLRRLIPASILVGAIFLTVIFDVAYFFGMTDSMNVITSALGCVVMVTVLLRKGGEKNAADQRPGPAGMGFR